MWHRSNIEDKLAIEGEQFDNVVGFADKEQIPIIESERINKRRCWAM